MNPQADPAITTCGNCHSPMPRELRFCRNCGFRLGEGSAEYTETVRFQNAPPGTLPGNSSGQFNQFSAPAGSCGLFRRRDEKEKKAPDERHDLDVFGFADFLRCRGSVYCDY